MTTPDKEMRIWELDFLRGAALILMIYFHVVFDMKDIYNYNVGYSSGINFFIGKVSAISFILTSGISCCLSRSNVKRGLKIFALAMVLTLVTHVYSPDMGIKFGILHFLGTGMILFPLFSRLNIYVLLLTGTAIIIAGYFILFISVANDYLFILGFISSNFASSDYYPFIPWLGVFMFGVAIGRAAYVGRKSIFPFTLKENPISRVGRHTLFYYLIHQPIIIILLGLINKFRY